MTYTLAPATEADAHELVPRLREAHRLEVLAFALDPLDSIVESVRASREAWTARAPDGGIICMAGVCPLTAIGQTGVPWLLGSDLVSAYRRPFMLETRRAIGRWLDWFPVLQNRVPFTYDATLRWARWLGFKVEPSGGFSIIRLEAPWSGIRPSNMTELWTFPNFRRLLDEYANEASVKGLPKPIGKMETYQRLEATGTIHTIVALRYGQLIGFINVLAPVLPHYDRTIAVSESFFVTRRHRKTGAGLRLLRAAERLAASLGSPGLLVSAPLGGALCEVLPHVGYTETNRTFFKRLSDG